MMNRGFLALSTVVLLGAGAGIGMLVFDRAGPDRTRATLVSVADKYCSGGQATFLAPPDPGNDIEAIIAGMENVAGQQKAIAICTRARMEIYAYDLAGEDTTRAQN
tara:strand:+ start:1196 stop:1513 length:318 start_codon:yes stop_codon:yes gene_type:complete